MTTIADTHSLVRATQGTCGEPRPLLRRRAHRPLPAPAGRPPRDSGRGHVGGGVPVHGPAGEAGATDVDAHRG